MKPRMVWMMVTLAAACLATLAAPQSDKQPVTSSTGRFGDATGIATKYRLYFWSHQGNPP